MNSIVRPLYDLIRHCIFCQEQFEPYKLNQKQVTEVWSWLDHRRRDSVDVSDFYAKFQDLTESELFFVFKHLDVSRRGSISFEDLLTVLLSSSPTNTQTDAIRNFTNFIKILKASFHLIEEQKNKLNINSELLQEIFKAIVKNNKQKLEMMDFIVFVKEVGLQVDEKLLIYLQNNVFQRSPKTLNEFVQIFAPLKWNNSLKQIPSTIQKAKPQCPQNNGPASNNSQIERILQKYKTPNSISQTYSPQFNYETQNFDVLKQKSEVIQKSKINNFELNENWRVQNYDSDVYSKFYEEQRKYEENTQASPSSTSAQPFSEINKRRQQLRRGSLERQKIIDQIVNKKKNVQPVQIHNSKYTSPHSHSYSNNIAHLKIQTKGDEIESRFYKFQDQRPATPTQKASRVPFEATSFERSYTGKIYENLQHQKSNSHLTRPSSANKTANNFYDKSCYGKIINYNELVKPELSQYLNKSKTQVFKSGYTYQKQNILKRAEEEATKKIQQIERRARLKVMQKRSSAGVYNRWLK